MSPDVIAVGIFSIVGAVAGAVVGVVAGLFGERWVRSRGAVRCQRVDWRVIVGPTTNPTERQLEVRFVNEKELPVIVLDMWVAFYKGGAPLEEWVRPQLTFVNRSDKSPLSPVNVPGRSAVMRTFSVIAGRDDIQRQLATTDRAEFVANIVGAGERRAELSPPWRD
jgi:hypothetical protein